MMSETSSKYHPGKTWWHLFGYTFHMAIWTGIMMITTIHWNWMVTGCPISRPNHVGSYGFVSIPSSWLWSVITYPAYNKVMFSQLDNLQNYEKEPPVVGWFIPLLARFATLTGVYSKHIWLIWKQVPIYSVLFWGILHSLTPISIQSGAPKMAKLVYSSKNYGFWHF